jgi:hypothetical protein
MKNIIIYFIDVIYNILLSLYPIFNKTLGINEYSKNLYRNIIVLCTSFITSDFKNIKDELINIQELIPSILNLVHISCSYYGFKYLTNNIASSIFYIYPL